MGIKRKGEKTCALCNSEENLRQITSNRFLCSECIDMLKNVK